MAELYRGMDRAALDAAYNNGAAVRNSAQIVTDWQARSDRLRTRHAATMDLRYGPAERNRVDLFPAGPAAAPLLVFVHGGYWQMRAKEVFAFVASGPLAHGISVALAGYTLAPQIRLDGIVAEIRACLDYLSKKHSHIVLSGWSAGGHLTAMALSHPRVTAGLAISGVFELAPIRDTYLNEKLRLTDEEIATLSPLRLPVVRKPLAVAYGTKELPALVADSRDLQARRTAAGAPGPLVPISGADHFTILEELRRPDGALVSAARALV